MITFGFVYGDDGITVYDLTRELRGGQLVYVASLSAAPGVSFSAHHPEDAVQQLKTFLHHRSLYNAMYLAAPAAVGA